MSVEFSDILNDAIKRELILKSDLITDLRIYLGQPKQGGLLLAQARTALWSAVEFHIEISANVDIAMTVMFCIAAAQNITERDRATRNRGIRLEI